MPATIQTTQRGAGVGPTHVFMGLAAGLMAGVAYLLAQMSFSAFVYGGSAWEPLQRIAAMLLGPDAAPPETDVGIRVIGIALLIHLPLAAVYGRILATLCNGCSEAAVIARGALLGLAAFVLHFWIVAPLAFPWFEQSRNLGTALDHVIFGLVMGLCYVQLVRSVRGRPHPG